MFSLHQTREMMSLFETDVWRCWLRILTVRQATAQYSKNSLNYENKTSSFCAHLILVDSNEAQSKACLCTDLRTSCLMAWIWYLTGAYSREVTFLISGEMLMKRDLSLIDRQTKHEYILTLDVLRIQLVFFCGWTWFGDGSSPPWVKFLYLHF